MSKFALPAKPRNDGKFDIPKEEKELLMYVTAMGVPKDVAFARWHPEFLSNTGRLTSVGREACAQFFHYAKNREFMDAYRNELLRFCGMPEEKTGQGGDTEPEEAGASDDKRKNKALKLLLDKAMRLVESGEPLDPDSLKTVADIFRKTNLLKDEQEQMESPRRYLPVRCLSECRYRLFVEEHVKSGDITDECEVCRTRRFAEEHGWIYDPTHNLDLLVEEPGDGQDERENPDKKDKKDDKKSKPKHQKNK